MILSDTFVCLMKSLQHVMSSVFITLFVSTLTQSYNDWFSKTIKPKKIKIEADKEQGLNWQPGGSWPAIRGFTSGFRAVS